MPEKSNRRPSKSNFVGFDLFFRQGNAGWSDYAIVLGNQFAHYVPSYLSHALGDLASAAVKLARGEDSVRFSFEDEPGEYRWIIESAGTDSRAGDLIRIKILEFDTQFAYSRDGVLYPAPDSEGTTRLDGVCSKVRFLSVIRTVLQEALTINGLEGYRRKTIDHDFPETELRELESLIETPDSKR